MKHDIFCIVVGIPAQCNPPNRRSLKHRKNSGCDTVLGTYCL